MANCSKCGKKLELEGALPDAEPKHRLVIVNMQDYNERLLRLPRACPTCHKNFCSVCTYEDGRCVCPDCGRDLGDLSDRPSFLADPDRTSEPGRQRTSPKTTPRTSAPNTQPAEEGLGMLCPHCLQNLPVPSPTGFLENLKSVFLPERIRELTCPHCQKQVSTIKCFLHGSFHHKVACTKCGAMILGQTVKVTGGLCMPCAQAFWTPKDEDGAMPEIPDSDPGKLREMAVDSIRNGNLKIAAAAWRSLAKTEPATAETHFLRAAALHALRDIDAATDEYRTAVGLERTNPEAHLCLGMLLTDNAVDKMSKTGQQFTMDGALKHYGCLDDALRAFATAEALNEKLQAETIAEHLRHYRALLGAVYMMAKPIDDLTGDPVCRKRSDWLSAFAFTQENLRMWTISQVADQIRDSRAQNRVLFALGHPPLPGNLAAILKHRRQKALRIGAAMKDDAVRNALKAVQPGSVVLGDIERVALGSDFSWIQQESINRVDLVMLDTESMLLPEIMGALQRTANPEAEDFQRRCFFVTITK